MAGMMAPAVPLLLACAAILLVAAATQALTGFGFALVAVPLLAAVTSPRTAVVGTSLAAPLLTLATAMRDRGHVRWRTAALLVGASALGMPAGLLVLKAAPERALTALIGLVALACTLLVWRGLRLRGGTGTVGAVGVLSGVLSTSTGTTGPPLVAAFQAMGYGPRAFRGTLAAVFSGSGVLSLAGLAVSGQVRAAGVAVGLAGVPAVAVGWWAGNRLFSRVDPVRFRQLALAGLLVSSLATLARAAL
jgi:uncharacterized membrane protein YfcA